MRETREEAIISGEFINNVTGEVSSIDFVHQLNHRNYSIKRLNMKVWDVGLDWVCSKVINSNLDQRMFVAIKQSLDKDNEFRKNVTNLSKEINTSGSNMRRMIKKLVDINFLTRKERGVYIANPFVVRNKGMTNIKCESLQKQWKDMIGEPTIEGINLNHSL